MATNLTRLSTADAYDAALQRLSTRQQELSRMQENLTAGKRVLRASDDPTAAAQAERARTRMSRIATDQRALDVQRNALSTAESTLGNAGTLMQSLRELIVKAGNTTTYSATDRDAMALEMRGLRDQILALANEKDGNGAPLFAGLGSTAAPFVDAAGGVVFQGIPGQAAATTTTVPSTLDGFATWMNVPTGNGIVTITQAAGTSAVWSDQSVIADPGALTGHDYSIQFTVTAGVTTYSVVDNTSATTVVSNQPYVAGKDITFDGLKVTLQGTPVNGDSLSVAPSTRNSVFDIIDRAIAIVDGSAGGPLAHDVARSLSEVDSAMSRLQSSRAQAGELLNRVDNITDSNSARTIIQESDRSRAEDLDMVKGLSDFKTQETAYSAALASYAQIQKLSLFNFLS
ncbi:flagellar hook-associated protein FlgL [Variovorax sp. VNK109]|jgi:flagellar hook-associated protein 3 FlgL|uniref:flagellar hook-associated protein FlgL n=1 Tax=Variovorax sp. VNK109 TaxID=3400919 RepID=UPI003C0501B6